MGAAVWGALVVLAVVVAAGPVHPPASATAWLGTAAALAIAGIVAFEVRGDVYRVAPV